MMINDGGGKGDRGGMHGAGLTVWLATWLNVRDRGKVCRAVHDNLKLPSIYNWEDGGGIHRIRAQPGASSSLKGKRKQLCKLFQDMVQVDPFSPTQTEPFSPCSRHNSELPEKESTPAFCDPVASVPTQLLATYWNVVNRPPALEPLKSLSEMRNLWLLGRPTKLGSAF